MVFALTLARFWAVQGSQMGPLANYWGCGHLRTPNCIHFHKNFPPGSHGAGFKSSKMSIFETKNPNQEKKSKSNGHFLALEVSSMV